MFRIHTLCRYFRPLKNFDFHFEFVSVNLYVPCIELCVCLVYFVACVTKEKTQSTRFLFGIDFCLVL